MSSTMYFESREDDVRIPGWSKDGKNANPQVVLGLLVGPGSNPIGYEIHPGNSYEGHTMIPIIEKLQKRFGFPKPIIVADAGLLSKENIRDLEEGGYEYILGARIRSQREEFKEQIAALGLSNGQNTSIELTKTRRIVVTMSDARARKNAADRERGLKRLEKHLRSDKLTKDKLNNRGYNRFLTMSGDATIKIDYDKVAKDERLDGYKGYTTNSTRRQAQIGPAPHQREARSDRATQHHLSKLLKWVSHCGKQEGTQVSPERNTPGGESLP